MQLIDDTTYRCDLTNDMFDFPQSLDSNLFAFLRDKRKIISYEDQHTIIFERLGASLSEVAHFLNITSIEAFSLLKKLGCAQCSGSNEFYFSLFESKYFSVKKGRANAPR